MPATGANVTADPDGRRISEQGLVTERLSARGRLRASRKRALQGIISIALVAGIFAGVLPRMAEFSEVWSTIRTMTGAGIASLVAVSLVNLASYWLVLAASLPGLRVREAAVVNQASTAISNTLPGGGALAVGVSVAMLNSWGFRMAAIARSTVITGIWNAYVKLAMPVLAVALLAVDGGLTVPRVLAAATGVIAITVSAVGFGLMLRSERIARAIGRRAGRVLHALRRLAHQPPLPHVDDTAAAFRSDSIGLLRRRWAALTLTTLASHVTLYVVLLMTIRLAGVTRADLGWIQVFAGFAFVRLLSALPITPGGIGVVELGYAATLGIGLDPTTRAQVVAAILVFRAITYLLPVPLGAAGYVAWRANGSWRTNTTERDRMAGPAHTPDVATPRPA